MSKRIKLVPKDSVNRYECFDCGDEMFLVGAVQTCPICGEKENFHLMN